MGRFVADRLAGVALQLASNCRCRAIQICSNLPDRAPRGTKTGHFAALFERQLVVVFSHGNTLVWCCTSFENSGAGSRKRSILRRLEAGPSDRRAELVTPGSR